MWAEAAGWLQRFDDAVLTFADGDGYPVSIRVDTSAYERASGELPVALHTILNPTDGPADLLCHRHNEKLWGLQFIHLAGRVEPRGDTWAFVTTSFARPPRAGVIGFARDLSRSADRYLSRRGLERPVVNWAAIKEIQRRARTR